MRRQANFCHGLLKLLGALGGSCELLHDGVGGRAGSLGALAQRQQRGAQRGRVLRAHGHGGHHAAGAVQKVDDVRALADGVVVKVVDGIGQAANIRQRNLEVLCHLAHGLGELVWHRVERRGHFAGQQGEFLELACRHLHAGGGRHHLGNLGGGNRNLPAQLAHIGLGLAVHGRELAHFIAGTGHLAGNAKHGVFVL